jgi:hypothetical protein
MESAKASHKCVISLLPSAEAPWEATRYASVHIRTVFLKKSNIVFKLCDLFLILTSAAFDELFMPDPFCYKRDFLARCSLIWFKICILIILIVVLSSYSEHKTPPHSV